MRCALSRSDLFERAGARADIARDVAAILARRRPARPHDARASAARGLSRRSRATAAWRSPARPKCSTAARRRRPGMASACPGPWLTLRALERATAMARECGTGSVVIRRSHHIACLAAYLKRATDAGPDRDHRELRPDGEGGSAARRLAALHHAESASLPVCRLQATRSSSTSRHRSPAWAMSCSSRPRATCCPANG